MLQFLAGELDWSERKLAHIQKRIGHSRPDRPVLLDDKLQWAQVSPIASRLHHLPGIDVEAGSYRHYPYAELTSHLIGADDGGELQVLRAPGGLHSPHEIRRVFYETGAANENCLTCHRDPDITGLSLGTAMSLYVDEQAYFASAHSTVSMSIIFSACSPQSPLVLETEPDV